MTTMLKWEPLSCHVWWRGVLRAKARSERRTYRHLVAEVKDNLSLVFFLMLSHACGWKGFCVAAQVL